MRISTHTLTWSVTFNKRYSTLSNHISTHTLTWSVTQLFWLQWFCHTISTHTLTWSVTCWQGEDNPCTVHFNSHAHVERDCYDVKSYINIFISTHTLTWSVTLTRRLKRSSSTFQLTRSRGAWLLLFCHLKFLLKFQLTRSRGAWPFYHCYIPCLHTHFNSHAHVERDQSAIVKLDDLVISTHTLTWSVTLDVVYIWCLLNVMRTYFFI